MNMVEDFLKVETSQLFKKTADLSMAAIPPVVVGTVLLAITGKVCLWLRDGWKRTAWQVDLREFRQESYTRFHRINAVVLTMGAIATVMVVLKDLGSTLMLASVGGIWLGLAGIAVLNYLMVVKMASYDGSDLAPKR